MRVHSRGLAGVGGEHDFATMDAAGSGAVPAGTPIDPCCHLACDSPINGHPDNISDEALAVNSDAVAHFVLTFAMTTSSTNGTDQASSNATKSSDEWKGSDRRR